MHKKYLLPLTLIFFILVINVIRFVDLQGVPNGFMFDEETCAVTLQCLAEKGIAPLSDQKYPLFAELGVGNPIPPTYMYPGILWVKLFGFSEASIRALTAFSFIVALGALFAIGRHVGGYMCGLWILLAGSISPWTWTYTRIGWQAPFLLPFLLWGLFICLRAKRLWEFTLAGILLSAAVYSYPTAKMQAPLLLIILGFYGAKNLQWKRSRIITLVASFFITTLPLIYARITEPALNAHFKDVFITNPDYLHSIKRTSSLPDLIATFIDKTLFQFSPDYLFFRGTPTDLGMTTGRQGLLSWLDALALILILIFIFLAWKRKHSLIKKENRPWAMFVLANIIIGIAPATVCYNNDPLHSMAAWPFVMITTGMIIHKATKEWAWAWLPALLTAVIFAEVFLVQYFTYYKKESAKIFWKWSSEMAQTAKTDEDWMKFLYYHYKDGFASRFFLMRYHGNDCLEARDIWQQMYPFFKKMAEENKK